jgi:hypothetical protein
MIEVLKSSEWKNGSSHSTILPGLDPFDSLPCFRDFTERDAVVAIRLRALVQGAVTREEFSDRGGELPEGSYGSSEAPKEDDTSETDTNVTCQEYWVSHTLAINPRNERFTPLATVQLLGQSVALNCIIRIPEAPLYGVVTADGQQNGKPLTNIVELIEASEQDAVQKLTPIRNISGYRGPKDWDGRGLSWLPPYNDKDPENEIACSVSIMSMGAGAFALRCVSNDYVDIFALPKKQA